MEREGALGGEPGADGRVRALSPRAVASKVREECLPHAVVPGTLNRLRIATQAGEQFRVFPSLPFKLVVFDRRIAILPLHLDKPDGPVLLVRSSSLLDALCEMFEMYWRAAAPFLASDMATVPAGATDANSVHADVLIPLLASGMNDKSIEHELDMSPRTLARRIVELTKRLGATTRFQAGWLAAQAMRGNAAQAKGV